jgi:hypothetical protein
MEQGARHPGLRNHRGFIDGRSRVMMDHRSICDIVARARICAAGDASVYLQTPSLARHSP